MNVRTPAIPVVATSTTTAVGLVLDVSVEGRSCIIHATGELDRATSGKLIVTSTTGHHLAMVIELDDVTFMDSSGYEALVESRRIVEEDGRTLTFRGQTGEPARLLELVAKWDLLNAGSGSSDPR